MLGLASNHWRMKETLKFLPQGCAIGVFDGKETFGDVLPNLKTLLNTGKVPAVRIHAVWDDDHHIASLAVLQKRLPRYELLARQYPNIKFFVSHSCEYKERSLAEVKKRVDLVVKLCPSCEPVQTPMAGSPTVPGLIIESHGKNAKSPMGIVSGDGQENVQLDMVNWNQRNASSVIRFSWGLRCNGVDADDVEPGKPKIPRPIRTDYPSTKDLNMMYRVLLPIGIPPTPTFPGKVTPLTKPMLWKAAAEDMDGINPRDNKGLAILKTKSDFIELMTFQGQIVTKLPYYGGYTGGLHRYYSGLYGYEIGQKARAMSGSEFVWIKQGRIGPINPSFRCGYYQ